MSCHKCRQLAIFYSLWVLLPRRTSRKTRWWCPDCRASWRLCRSTAACVSCTWAPPTRPAGTPGSGRGWAGSRRAATFPAPSHLKGGDQNARNQKRATGEKSFWPWNPFWWNRKQRSKLTSGPQPCLKVGVEPLIEGVHLSPRGREHGFWVSPALCWL